MTKIYVLTSQNNVEDPYEPGNKNVIGVYSFIELAQWSAQNHLNNTTDLLIKLDFSKDPTYTTYVENTFRTNSYSIEELLLDNFEYDQ